MFSVKFLFFGDWGVGQIANLLFIVCSLCVRFHKMCCFRVFFLQPFENIKQIINEVMILYLFVKI